MTEIDLDEGSSSFIYIKGTADKHILDSYSFIDSLIGAVLRYEDQFQSIHLCIFYGIIRGWGTRCVSDLFFFFFFVFGFYSTLAEQVYSWKCLGVGMADQKAGIEIRNRKLDEIYPLSKRPGSIRDEQTEGSTTTTMEQ
jgi:hypothetical protein